MLISLYIFINRIELKFDQYDIIYEKDYVY